MAAIRIGTSGFSYQHWKGLFYPEGLPQNRWLEFYTGHFSTVELNVTFYRLPSEKAMLSWRQRAPEGFIYAVKLGRRITHSHRLHDAEDEMAFFLDRMRLLNGCLGPILVQLPPGMKANVGLLDTFLLHCDPALRWTVEFRNPSWFTEDTYAVLRRYGVALCMHDYLVEHPLEITAPFTYLRFHGVDHLYSGDYPDDVLRTWAGRLREWRTQDKDAYVYFNNDVGGYAVKNAKMLLSMIG